MDISFEKTSFVEIKSKILILMSRFFFIKGK